jgi:hypothetical protein
MVQIRSFHFLHEPRKTRPNSGGTSTNPLVGGEKYTAEQHVGDIGRRPGYFLDLILACA